MTLQKRIRRGLRKNLSFYITGSVLTALCIMLWVGAFSASRTLSATYNKLYEQTSLEDGQFTTSLPLTDGDIEALESEFGVLLERQLYRNLPRGDSTLRLLSHSPKINRAVVFEGSPLGDCNDVLITYNYAKAQGISVDDTITLADREFTVCGLCIRPDYAAMYANFEDSFPNSVDFGIAVINKSAMEQLGEYSGLYSVKYLDASQEAAFRSAVSERYQTLEYVMKSANPRTGALLTQAGDLEAEFSVYSPIIMLAVVVVIAMVLIRTVKRDGKTIGTLMALGYRKGELIAHYMRYALIPAVFGDILGLALCYPFSKLFNLYIFNFAEHINYSVKLPVGILIIALALPPLILTARAPRRCFAGRSEMI